MGDVKQAGQVGPAFGGGEEAQMGVAEDRRGIAGGGEGGKEAHKEGV